MNWYKLVICLVVVALCSIAEGKIFAGVSSYEGTIGSIARRGLSSGKKEKTGALKLTKKSKLSTNGDFSSTDVASGSDVEPSPLESRSAPAPFSGSGTSSHDQASESEESSGTPVESPVSGPVDEAAPSQTPASGPVEGAPTEIPATSMPTGQSFDISSCESYSLNWLADLLQTCNSPTFEDSDGCECTTAEALMRDGVINCETATCPDSCEVCSFCIQQIGC